MLDDRSSSASRATSKPSITQEQVDNAAISLSINEQEAANIGFTQTVTFLAVGKSIIEHFPSDKDRPDLDYLNLEDKEIGLGVGLCLSTLAAISWYVVNAFANKSETKEQALKRYQTIKTQLNPWYRRFKTGVFFGNNIGLTFAEAIIQTYFFILPNWLRWLIRSAASALGGIITGLLAIAFFSDDDEKNSIFRLGRDGWARYAKVGMRLGNFIGAAVGLSITVSGGMTTGILIGTAVGGVIGFAIMLIAIPLVNLLLQKIRANQPPKTPTNSARTRLLRHVYGLTPTLPRKSTEHQRQTSDTAPLPHLYRVNYIQIGIFSGAALGFIVAFASAYFFAPLAIMSFVTYGAAIGALIGAIGLGIGGHYISKAISPIGDRAYSSWDYGARTGSSGGQNGIAFLLYGILVAFGVDKHVQCLKELLTSVFGLLMATLGAAYDGIVVRKLQTISEEEFKKNKPLIPWSQRVGTFFTLAGFAGGFIGYFIGTLIAGPFGGFVGSFVGAGAGTLISGVIGALWGETIYLKYAKFSTFIASKLKSAQKKIDQSFELIPPKNTTSKNPMQKNKSTVFVRQNLLARLNESETEKPQQKPVSSFFAHPPKKNPLLQFIYPDTKKQPSQLLTEERTLLSSEQNPSRQLITAGQS